MCKGFIRGARISTKIRQTLTIVALALCAMTSFARDFLNLESSYLGDGWFRYRVICPDHPFFQYVNLTGFNMSFTNRLETTFPASGTPEVNDNGFSWNSDVFVLTGPARPYERIFLAHSSYTNYVIAPASISLLSLSFIDMPGAGSSYVSGNIVGYAIMDCVVPSAVPGTNGTPTNYLKGVPGPADVVIDQLVMEGGNVRGIQFSRDQDITVRLEASPDTVQWRPVTYLFGSPPTTTWTTNVALNEFGNFFRLGMVAEGHYTNLPPLNSIIATAKSVTQKTQLATVNALAVRDQSIAATIQTTPGTTYRVQLLNSLGKSVETQEFAADAQIHVSTFAKPAEVESFFVRAMAITVK